jgi:hypothetical protein
VIDDHAQTRTCPGVARAIERVHVELLGALGQRARVDHKLVRGGHRARRRPRPTVGPGAWRAAGVGSADLPGAAALDPDVLRARREIARVVGADRKVGELAADVAAVEFSQPASGAQLRRAAEHLAADACRLADVADGVDRAHLEVDVRAGRLVVDLVVQPRIPIERLPVGPIATVDAIARLVALDARARGAIGKDRIVGGIPRGLRAAS